MGFPIPRKHSDSPKKKKKKKKNWTQQFVKKVMLTGFFFSVTNVLITVDSPEKKEQLQTDFSIVNSLGMISPYLLQKLFKWLLSNSG